MATVITSAFIEKIKASRPVTQNKTRRPSVALMRAEAKRRAVALGDLSHEELVQRFIDATDKIRAEAIEKGVAIEGEWEGD